MDNNYNQRKSVLKGDLGSKGRLCTKGLGWEERLLNPVFYGFSYGGDLMAGLESRPILYSILQIVFETSQGARREDSFGLWKLSLGSWITPNISFRRYMYCRITERDVGDGTGWNIFTTT
jgi:hypothetical protein